VCAMLVVVALLALAIPRQLRIRGQ